MPKVSEVIPKKVLEMNLEICFFNQRLKKHLQTNAVDIQMIHQLQETMQLICALLGMPSLIEADTLDVVSLVNGFDVHRQLFCEICNVGVKADVYRLREHLDSRKHIKFEQDLKAGNQKALLNSQTYVNSTLQKPPDNAAPPPINPTANAVKGMVVVRNKDDAASKNAENGGDASTKKLSKKVKDFLRDCRLEHYAQKLMEEGVKVLHSPSHTVVANQISDVLQQEFPLVQVYPFGSRLSGLGSESSDLDLYVDLNANYFNNPIVLPPKSFKHIEDCLRATHKWAEFVPIINARTPILRVYNLTEKIDCDLSFGNGLSHCNTRLIQYFIDIQPIFGKVAALVKHYAHVADFKMNSYIITLLVVYYFQVHMLLPPVHDLQKTITPQFVGPWQGNFEMIPWTKKCDAFGKHLIGFFDFYGSKFNFKTQVVCPFLGIPLSKTSFKYKSESLPNTMKHYLKYMKSLDMSKADPLVDLFAYDKDMVVQDPLELCHNVAKGVRYSSLERFVSYCRLTAETLRQKKKL